MFGRREWTTGFEYRVWFFGFSFMGYVVVNTYSGFISKSLSIRVRRVFYVGYLGFGRIGFFFVVLMIWRWFVSYSGRRLYVVIEFWIRGWF